MERGKGPIDVTPAKTFEPEKKSVDSTVNKEMAKAKRVKKVEEKIPGKVGIEDERAAFPLETSSLLVKSKVDLGGLKPAPASRLRGTYPHLSCSLVAHFLPQINRKLL